MKIAEIKTLVTHALIKYPHLRDDDNKLVATIWINEIGGKESGKQLTATDFLERLSKGLLISAESIRRVRRKLQETNESLRGSKYLERLSKEEEFIKTIKKV